VYERILLFNVPMVVPPSRAQGLGRLCPGPRISIAKLYQTEYEELVSIESVPIELASTL
jgi:hypothetical protein